VDACSPAFVARVAGLGGLLLSGCLTVGPAGFVRQGEHACYRAWCDVNTLNAPALYFETARRIPYAEERVQCYPPIDRRMPGPRLLLATHQSVPVGPPDSAATLAPPQASPGPTRPPAVAPAPVTSEPELLPPPPAP
jgi:hypothetical protein